MSRWWRDEIRVALAPHGVELLRAGKGWARKVLAVREAPLPEPTDCRDWHPALDALTEQLNAVQWRSADLAVELSSHFVRYAVIAWDDSLRNEAEVLAYARHHLRSTYGEAADAWDACMSDEAPGKERVLAAVDRELIESLRALARRHSLRLAHVEPAFAAAVNAHSRLFTDAAFYLAVIEPLRVCIGRADHAGWGSIHNMRAADPMGALAGFLRQEMLQATDTISRRVYVSGAEQPAADRMLLDGWEVVRLDRNPAGARSFARSSENAHGQAA